MVHSGAVPFCVCSGCNAIMEASVGLFVLAKASWCGGDLIGWLLKLPSGSATTTDDPSTDDRATRLVVRFQSLSCSLRRCQLFLDTDP